MNSEDTNKLLAILAGGVILALVTYALVGTIHVKTDNQAPPSTPPAMQEEPGIQAQIHSGPFYGITPAPDPDPAAPTAYVSMDWRDLQPAAAPHAASTNRLIASRPAPSSSAADPALPIYLLPAEPAVYLPGAGSAQAQPLPNGASHSDLDAPILVDRAIPSQGAAPGDRPGIQLAGQQALWLVNLKLDPDGVLHHGLPTVGLSGKAGIFAYDVTIDNPSDKPVDLLPDRLSFDDGSLEHVFLAKNDWTGNPGTPGGTDIVSYSPALEGNFYVELPPNQSTTFRIFAENSAAPGFGTSPAASGVPTAPKPRAPKSLRFFEITQPAPSVTLPEDASAADRMKAIASIVDTLEHYSTPNQPVLDIPVSPQALTHFQT